jgi:hypothetical protein
LELLDVFSKYLKSRYTTLVAVLSLAPALASATPVSYFGAQFDLSIADIGVPGFVYRVTYTADFTHFTNGAAQPFIDAVAWKHAGADVVTATLVSDPGFGWITSADSTVNSSGCSSNGGNTWACAQDFLPPFVPTSGILTWEFDVTFSSIFLSNLNTTGDSIKARFVDAYGNKQGALLSCTLNGNTDDNCDTVTRQVPEPATIGLMGLGLLGIALVGVGVGARNRRLRVRRK